MTSRSLSFVFCSVSVLALSLSVHAQAADSFSDADKAFVAKVSQGGMFEVALGKLGETKAMAQDVKDSSQTEASDHALVGDKLKTIVEASGSSFPTSLNADFQAQLDQLGALPPDQFDPAYLKAMKKIHAADGAAFAKEAKAGTSPELRAFAAETYRIVQRHIGELSAKVD